MTGTERLRTGPALQLGKYRLIIELAQGGMGHVYLAVAQGPAGFSKLTVVKELKPSLVEEHGFLEMFLDEARLSARLNHPNVVQTNEVAFEGGHAFLAMEYLEGQSLVRVRSRLGKAGRFPLPAHLRVLAEALAGLHYAHELRDFDGTPLHVVHRDVSPHNVFVTYDGQVKIVDFGVAKAMSSNHETTVGVMKGKVPYMAPEQVLGTPADRRVDVFAMGIMVWEAVAQRRIWEGLRSETILARLMQSDVPRLAEIVPHAPPRLIALVDRATAFHPEARFESADAMRRELEAYLAEVPGGDVASLRELGAVMSELFAVERDQVTRAIQEQLQLLREPTRATAVGILRLPASATGSHPSVTGPPSQHRSLPPGLSGMGSLPGGAAGGNGGSGATASLAVAKTYAPGAPQPAPSTSKGVVVGVAIAALLLASLVAVALVLRTRGAPPAMSVETRASGVPSADVLPTPSTAAASDVPQTISLTVTATPASARLYLDNAELPGNPHTARFRRDGVSHKVRAEAPGYVTKAVLVSFDEDRTVSLELEKRSTGGPAAKPPPPPPPPASATPEHGKPSKPKRTIDTDVDFK